MSMRWSHERALRLSQGLLVAYFLIFQTWPIQPDYPEGVLSANYQPVGIFHFLPGPLSDSALWVIHALWPVFLLLSLAPRLSKVALLVSFLLGCYVLGYDYNFGRVFHGTSLALQMLLLLAIAMPSSRTPAASRETRARAALRAGQFLIALSYFSAGLMKLMKSGPSWAFSENLAVILHTQPLLTPMQDLLLDLPAWVLRGLAVLTLFVEVTSLAPWFVPRLTGFYLAAWAAFHLGVHFAFGGHSTFFSHFFLYSFFLTALIPPRETTRKGQFSDR